MLVADRALYAAKAAGRRRVAVWEDGPTRVVAHMAEQSALVADGRDHPPADGPAGRSLSRPGRRTGSSYPAWCSAPARCRPAL